MNRIMRNKKSTAYNKRFGEIGVKVIVRISMCPLTVSDNPNCVQLRPNFAKPPRRKRQCGGDNALGKRSGKIDKKTAKKMITLHAKF